MVVYREKSNIYDEVNSQTVANSYGEHINTIADCISKLSDVADKIGYLHDVTEDNGDVGIQLEEALLKLGVALATACNYRKEYQDEADGKVSSEEN